MLRLLTGLNSGVERGSAISAKTINNHNVLVKGHTTDSVLYHASLSTSVLNSVHNLLEDHPDGEERLLLGYSLSLLPECYTQVEAYKVIDANYMDCDMVFILLPKGTRRSKYFHEDDINHRMDHLSCRLKHMQSNVEETTKSRVWDYRGCNACRKEWKSSKSLGLAYTAEKQDNGPRQIITVYNLEDKFSVEATAFLINELILNKSAEGAIATVYFTGYQDGEPNKTDIQKRTKAFMDKVLGKVQ